MNRKEQLEKIIANARAELWTIEGAEAQERNSALIGNCYKYLNSYSGSEKWWLYLIVTGVADHSLTVFSFQRDCNGKIEIEPYSYRPSLNDGYKQIEQSEFMAAWEEVRTELNRITF